MSGAPIVVVREPGRVPLHVVVHESIEVGRDCPGLLLDDPLVSQRHLVLRRTAEGVTVSDLGSRNGTTLDGVPVTEPVRLTPGAQVRLGDTAIELAGETTGPSAAAPPAPTRTTIERLSLDLERERPSPPRQAIADGTVTIVFSDIESSTQLAVEYGDARWYEVLDVHNRLVRDRVARYDGVEIKAQGDGFMLAFGSARRAVLCMSEVQRALTDTSRAHPGGGVRVRVGVHTGEVITGDDGDLFGRHVNLAARIADAAQGGEILVSDLVHEIVAARGDLAFGSPRRVRLKGFDVEHVVRPVHWDAGAP